MIRPVGNGYSQSYSSQFNPDSGSIATTRTVSDVRGQTKLVPSAEDRSLFKSSFDDFTKQMTLNYQQQTKAMEDNVKQVDLV